MPVSESQLSVVVPRELLHWVEELMQSGRFQSYEHLLQRALWHGLTSLINERMDEEFSGMATDQEYQAEALQILAEFGDVDEKSRDR